jgi:hypothetical protein
LTKKCLFCGKYFVPDPRVGNRQKACRDEQCKKKENKLLKRFGVKITQGILRADTPMLKNGEKI